MLQLHRDDRLEGPEVTNDRTGIRSSLRCRCAGSLPGIRIDTLGARICVHCGKILNWRDFEPDSSASMAS